MLKWDYDGGGDGGEMNLLFVFCFGMKYILITSPVLRYYKVLCTQLLLASTKQNPSPCLRLVNQIYDYQDLKY